MPEGSSSEAPVIKPGPNNLKNLRNFFFITKIDNYRKCSYLYYSKIKVSWLCNLQNFVYHFSAGQINRHLIAGRMPHECIANRRFVGNFILARVDLIEAHQRKFLLRAVN